MHKRASAWTSWVGGAVLASALAAGVGALASSAGGSGDRGSLKDLVSELKSRAGVGRVVAEQAGAGRLTETFVEAQAKQMVKGVESARAKLVPEEFESELGGEVARASDLALRLRGALRALEEGRGERAALESAARGFEVLYREAAEMEEGLKR